MENRPFTAPMGLEDEREISFARKNFEGMLALIDADRYKHLATYRMYKAVVEEGQEHSPELLHQIVDDYIDNDIISRFSCKAYIFCFSAPSKEVFRNSIAQEKGYKANRSKVDNYYYEGKYEDMARVFTYLKGKYTTLAFDDLEADDILSMLQDQEDTFIFSHDKDLKQCPGFHYNMEENALDFIDEDTGFTMLVDQMLTGDTTDNIPGLKGFGPKALEKFKEQCTGFDKRQLLFAALDEYISRHGELHGFDLFAEMWHLLSMRLDRGDHCKERYQSAFKLKETFLR